MAWLSRLAWGRGGKRTVEHLLSETFSLGLCERVWSLRGPFGLLEDFLLYLVVHRSHIEANYFGPVDAVVHFRRAVVRRCRLGALRWRGQHLHGNRLVFHLNVCQG